MPCRVGITTDPKQRKEYWKSRVDGFKNWRTHGHYEEKNDAQAKEDSLVQHCTAHGNRGACYGHAGGGDPDEKGWTVYSFNYKRARRA